MINFIYFNIFINYNGLIDINLLYVFLKIKII